MARIRNIKPDLFRHGELFDLERRTGLPVRLAWIGLWCQCDCAGRFRWKPRELKVEVMPYDDVDFGAVLDALAEGGFVVRYSVDGKEYGEVPNFGKHQRFTTGERKDGPKYPPKDLGSDQGADQGQTLEGTKGALTTDDRRLTGDKAQSARSDPPASPSASTGPEPDQDIAGTVLAEYRAVANELGIVVATSAADSGDAKAIGDALPAEDDRRDVFRAALGPGAFRGPLRYIRQDLAKWWEDVEAERSRRARELDICETRQREPTEPPADPSKVDEMLARLPWRRA